MKKFWKKSKKTETADAINAAEQPTLEPTTANADTTEQPLESVPAEVEETVEAASEEVFIIRKFSSIPVEKAAETASEDVVAVADATPIEAKKKVPKPAPKPDVHVELDAYYARVRANLSDKLEHDPDYAWREWYAPAGMDDGGKMRKHFAAIVGDVFFATPGRAVSEEAMAEYFRLATQHLAAESLETTEMSPVNEVKYALLATRLGRDAFARLVIRDRANGGRRRIPKGANADNSNLPAFFKCWEKYFGSPLSLQAYYEVDQVQRDRADLWEKAASGTPFTAPRWVEFRPNAAATA